MAKLERVTTLTIQTRAKTGTTGAKAARREGNVPGVLYGHGSPLSIAVTSRDLADLLATGGQSHIVDATIDGKHDSVLLRDVQRHPISHRPIAADFQRVSQTEEINATVPVITVGVAPGVKDDGGVLDMVTHALEITGPAGKLPEELSVDVSELHIGGHIVASQVALPAGFTLITGGETTVVAIELTRAIAGETVPAEPVDAAAPVPAAGA
jgi:large subunit ribosomal protein L25